MIKFLLVTALLSVLSIKYGEIKNIEQIQMFGHIGMFLTTLIYLFYKLKERNNGRSKTLNR